MPPPWPPKPTELPWNTQFRRIGEPAVTRRPPPSAVAKLPVKISLASVGLPPLSHMPAPRSLGLPPSAWPPVMVKPSSMPEVVTEASTVTTWWLLSMEEPGVPMSPERIVTFTAGSR